MAFHPQAHSSPQVIQGNFQGRMPAFAAQAKPAFPQATQRQRAPHVQAAICKQCGYDLFGITHATCPECGVAIFIN